MLLVAFSPSLLWAYFLMVPGGSADRTPCLPTPSKLSNLPKQVFHPYLPTFPSARGVSQPYLPPAPLGLCFCLKVSFSFLQMHSYQGNTQLLIRDAPELPSPSQRQLQEMPPLSIPPQHLILPHWVIISSLGTSLLLGWRCLEGRNHGLFAL